MNERVYVRPGIPLWVTFLILCFCIFALFISVAALWVVHCEKFLSVTCFSAYKVNYISSIILAVSIICFFIAPIFWNYVNAKNMKYIVSDQKIIIPKMIPFLLRSQTTIWKHDIQNIQLWVPPRFGKSVHHIIKIYTRDDICEIIFFRGISSFI